ncbi:UDP-glucose 4-epimerase GalE [Pikeienuella piscinae]|uniref:UDP-glucose 4-epimerase n=1 Tax=Pikeienuella piscinae TaxID=2748098 RepID=A0A7L5BXI3_9RHOB|nr:UDP-glucose 4-epimerase GalE [Pikeienuella piscinae]QIE55853.1 UDP-glucose 4-epimerase GalE [Pikeienuella piscinae]
MTKGCATVLVTGGAGYIGAHACKLLKEAGHRPVVFDNFRTGWREAVRFGPLTEGDLLDPAAVRSAFDRFRPDAVMHFAALSDVGESMERPELYWRNNVVGSMNLLDAMTATGVGRLVFSSTCATYGEARGELTESHPQNPINAYGRSKLAVERMIGDYAALGIETVSFRYFNVAGADPAAEIGEHHEPETHLVPLLLDAIAGDRPEIVINGDDYETPDGTCIRDYLHVTDLAGAHVLGLRHLLDGGGSLTLNLGTGRGFSVREVIEAAERTTGRTAPVRVGPRRPGDTPRLVCSGAAAHAALGWRPVRSTMTEMIADAWAWRATGRFNA